MAYSRLRAPSKDLIKAVRACKTAADERACINRESAAIRTSFREESADARYNNISKLLYIHMLGYPSHFGQIECLKLVASPRFADKRLGYLGIMLLLDENQETLTLVTNSLKNDMNHSNVYVVGLALCTMANIASTEMSRDLCDEVEKLLGNSNSYVRKKAALCALRIVRKVPALQENFVDRAEQLIDDRNHGVALTGMTLITEMCGISEESLEGFRRVVPTLIRRLKNLVTAGFSPEHDVTGITDPFLQVKILRLLRVLGHDDPEVSELMNDIITQVANNTDGSKNVGNAILYETVLTIMETEADHALRVLAINLLGRFLANKDNNIRYVALTTLNKTITMDHVAVQRHKNTVLECLHDADISIRRRALDLAFALVNEQNVRVMTRELLAFLELADAEFKPEMTTRISKGAQRYAPNARWHIDTLLRVLRLAGAYVREEILSSFLRLVSRSPDLQAYTVRKLFGALRDDLSQEALVLAGLWCIGEYGELLVGEGAGGGSMEGVEGEGMGPVGEGEVVGLIGRVLDGPYADVTTREYALTALIKLLGRVRGAEAEGEVRRLIGRYDRDEDVEVQERAVQYGKLLSYPSIIAAVVERIPVQEGRDDVSASGGSGAPGKAKRTGSRKKTPAQAPKKDAGDLLLDIMGDDEPSGPAPIAGGRGGGGGVLDDLLGGGTPPPAQSTPPPQAKAGVGAKAGGKEYVVYEKDGLEIRMEPSRDGANPSVINFRCLFRNAGVGSAVQDLSFQVAVPKSQKLQMMPPSATTIPPGGQVTQVIRVANPNRTHVRLRLKLSYTTSAGGRVDTVGEYGGFPPTL